MDMELQTLLMLWLESGLSFSPHLPASTDHLTRKTDRCALFSLLMNLALQVALPGKGLPARDSARGSGLHWELLQGWGPQGQTLREDLAPLQYFHIKAPHAL